MSESDPLNQPQTVVFFDLIGVGIAPVSKKNLLLSAIWTLTISLESLESLYLYLQKHKDFLRMEFTHLFRDIKEIYSQLGVLDYYVVLNQLFKYLLQSQCSGTTHNLFFKISWLRTVVVPEKWRFLQKKVGESCHIFFASNCKK